MNELAPSPFLSPLPGESPIDPEAPGAGADLHLGNLVSGRRIRKAVSRLEPSMPTPSRQISGEKRKGADQELPKAKKPRVVTPKAGSGAGARSGADSKTHEVSHKVQQLQRQVDQVQAVANQRSKENAALKARITQLEGLQSQLVAAHATIATTERELVHANQSFAVAQENVDYWKKKCEGLEQVADDLRYTVSRQQGQIEDLKQNIVMPSAQDLMQPSAHSRVQELETQLFEVRFELTSEKQKVQDAQELVRQAQHDATAAKEMLANMQEKARQRRENIKVRKQQKQQAIPTPAPEYATMIGNSMHYTAFTAITPFRSFQSQEIFSIPHSVQNGAGSGAGAGAGAGSAIASTTLRALPLHIIDTSLYNSFMRV